jgi:hypothetical protein
VAPLGADVFAQIFSRNGDILPMAGWGRATIRGRIKDGLVMDDDEVIRKKLSDMRIEHRDLDDVIAHLAENPFVDQVQMRRLKKRKLQLKDQIARLESMLIPDLNA